MKFHIFTIFPDMYSSTFNEGVISRGIEKGHIQIFLHDIRDYTNDKHNKVDDSPFGGGPGMIMKPEPIFNAVETVSETHNIQQTTPRILLSPQGKPFNHKIAKKLSNLNEIIMICGRYEGFDERIRQNLATDEISIGDYILSGGEIASMAIIDSVARLIPGVLGSQKSPLNDSFYDGLLQFPQYTRPAKFREMGVPDIILSGNHSEIAKWRKLQSINTTKKRRPDLFKKYGSDI
tara:strand:+ start:9352 stop:10053 length:702 start_codon:yes stop_codon:yes gene_type:complete